MLMSPTVILLAYNHQEFIAEALKSALLQDYEGYELVIVDDASTDDTKKIIEEILRLYCRPNVLIRKVYHNQNLGLIAAVNSGMAAATGEIFVMMAGDDVSLPARLRLTLTAFEDPAVMLVVGDYQKINEEGRPYQSPPTRKLPRRCAYGATPALRIYGDSCPFGAAAGYRRILYDFFGPMQNGSHAEDNCFWVRALILGQVHHEEALFVFWRQHANNLSNFQVALTSERWRQKHLAWMEKHSSMSPQWMEDIEVAFTAGKLSFCRRLRLRIAGLREDAMWGLETSSLRSDPWCEWIRRAWKLIRLGRISTTFRMFKIRISRRRQDKRWKNWAELKSNVPV